ncbi:MAG TPA: hypothetical protein VHZ98_10345 [Galbitalea sp.]|nr:hypothetical protein [Galbitalea sp.]
MNENNSAETQHSHGIKRTRSLGEFALHTDDEEVRSEWEEGLAVWGTAFAAYTRLRRPELRTVDVLVAFREAIVASYPDWDSAIRQELTGLGWEPRFEQFRKSQGIPDELLGWNAPAIIALMKETYAIVEEDGEVHLFAR